MFLSHYSDQSIVNIPESLDDPNMQKSFDNRLTSTEEGAIFDKLKEDIKEEEDIAMKSALLLQLLEVGLFGNKNDTIFPLRFHIPL